MKSAIKNSVDVFRSFIETIAPLNRSICSPGLDQALYLIKREFIPELEIESYPTGSDAWTWILPRKWDIAEAYLSDGQRKLIDFKDEPLCVWSGSLSVDRDVSYDELMKHTHTDRDYPDLIRWYFRYYGTLDWGFNLPYKLVRDLDPKGTYRAVIKSRYYDDDFRVGSVFLPGKTASTILVISDICHPFQCNDSLTGAAVNLALYYKLRETSDRFYSYLFIFVPETIGTIAFLANNEAVIPDLVYAIYSEFLGRDLLLHFQQSVSGDTQLDRAAKEHLGNHYKSDQYKIMPFRQGGVTNDEMVLACPPMHVPSIAFNRRNSGPLYFREYHSNEDTPARLNFDKIEEGFHMISGCLDILEKNRTIPDPSEKIFRCAPEFSGHPEDDFVPVPKFKGPPFLSRFGLWVDWRVEPELNAAVDLIVACLDGNNSVAEIAAFVNLPYDTIRAYVECFEKQGLIFRKNRLA